MGGHRSSLAAVATTALLATCCAPEGARGPGGTAEALALAGTVDAEPGTAFELRLPRRGPPVVDVVVPGAGPARFLVDTGGQYTWIDRDFVRRHAIPTEPIDVRLTDATGRVSRVREAAVIRALGFAGTELTGLRPLVLDSIHRDVDGALGQDFLRSFLTIFDGPGRRLILLHGEQLLEDQHAAFERFGRVHVHEVDWSGGIPRVPLHVPSLSAELPFVLDTGSEHNTLPPDLIVQLAPRRVGTFASQGLSGPGPVVGLFELDGLQIGELLVYGLLIETPNPSLGWDTLRSTVTVFENATSSLYLMPGAVLHADWP